MSLEVSSVGESPSIPLVHQIRVAEESNILRIKLSSVNLRDAPNLLAAAFKTLSWFDNWTCSFKYINCPYHDTRISISTRSRSVGGGVAPDVPNGTRAAGSG